MKTLTSLMVFISILMFLVILASLMFAGCNDADPERARERVTKLVYMKDTKTDLCFAFYIPYASKMGMTEVPCNKVIDQLVK